MRLWSSSQHFLFLSKCLLISFIPSFSPSFTSYPKGFFFHAPLPIWLPLKKIWVSQSNTMRQRTHTALAPLIPFGSCHHSYFCFTFNKINIKINVLKDTLKWTDHEKHFLFRHVLLVLHSNQNRRIFGNHLTRINAWLTSSLVSGLIWYLFELWTKHTRVSGFVSSLPAVVDQEGPERVVVIEVLQLSLICAGVSSWNISMCIWAKLKSRLTSKTTRIEMEIHLNFILQEAAAPLEPHTAMKCEVGQDGFIIY